MPPGPHKPQQLTLSCIFFDTLYRKLFNPFSSPMRKLFLAPFYRTGNGGLTMFITCPGSLSKQVRKRVSNPDLLDAKTHPHVTPGSFSGSVTWKKLGIFAFFSLRNPEQKYATNFVVSGPLPVKCQCQTRCRGRLCAPLLLTGRHLFFNMCFAFHREKPFSDSHFLSEAQNTIYS